MCIVGYEWYKDIYGGELDQETFTRLSARAVQAIDALTGYRLCGRWSTLPASMKSGVRAAVCAYAEQAAVEEGGGPVVSESNDGISRTYAAGGSDRGGSTPQERLFRAVSAYLAPAGLLYRGVGR